MESPSFFAYWGSFIVLATFVHLLFWAMGDASSEESRKACSNWLGNIKTGETYENWAVTFGSIFDRILGEEHFSWKRFFRSGLASYASLVICFAAVYTFDVDFYNNDFERDGVLYSILSIFMGGAALNLIPDYFSLIQTRYFINFFERPRNNIFMPLALILDVFSTYILFFFALIIMAGLTSLVGLSDTKVSPFLLLFSPLDVLKKLINHRFLIVFLSTTFFTSIWLYFYLFSGWVIKYLKVFTRFLNIEEKPFKSLGIVSMSIVFIIYLIASPFVLFK